MKDIVQGVGKEGTRSCYLAGIEFKFYEMKNIMETDGCVVAHHNCIYTA